MSYPTRTYRIVVALVACWCVAIVAAPILGTSDGNLQALGATIYRVFSKICHQLDDRSFYVNGGKFGVCIRCSSIYFSFLATLVFLPFVKPLRVLRIPHVKWLVTASVPMLVDVLLNGTALRTSTALTRIVSGTLVGSVLPLYIVPPLLEAFAQISSRSVIPGGLHARKTK